MSYSFSRQELYDLVWAEPVSVVAKRFGISDVGLAKLCRRHDIPLPPRGHWAKVAAGKRTGSRPELPQRGIAMPDDISDDEHDWRRFDERPEEIPIPREPVLTQPLEDVVVRVQKLVGRVTVPRSLEQPHALIAKVLAQDESRREKQRATGYSWDAALFDSPYEKRRLRVLGAVFSALERCGTRPWLRGKEALEAGVTIGECALSFTLDDPGQLPNRYRPPTPANRPSTDKLKLAITFPTSDDGAPHSWQDAEGATVESKLTEIVTRMLVLAESAYREHQHRHHSWLKERKEQLIAARRERLDRARREEIERIEKANQTRVNQLLAEAGTLRQANEIREYVRTVHSTVGAEQNAATLSQVEAWAAWALGVADSIDPVIQKQKQGQGWSNECIATG
jgi:hypothetical protein